MAIYGLKVKDENGNIVKITPDLANVIKTDQVVMPSSLVDTDKYYAGVDLPENSNVSVNNIGIIMNAFLLNVNINLAVTSVGTSYSATALANTFYTQYTKNLSTGVMTAWVPGINQNPLTDSEWDLITSIYPETYWDKLSDSSVSKIKIFGAMRYHCYDASAATYIDSYMLGSTGVEKVDYVIVLNQKE